jgi:hypothetical protein
MMNPRYGITDWRGGGERRRLIPCICFWKSGKTLISSLPLKIAVGEKPKASVLLRDLHEVPFVEEAAGGALVYERVPSLFIIDESCSNAINPPNSGVGASPGGVFTIVDIYISSNRTGRVAAFILLIVYIVMD